MYAEYYHVQFKYVLSLFIIYHQLFAFASYRHRNDYNKICFKFQLTNRAFYIHMLELIPLVCRSHLNLCR